MKLHTHGSCASAPSDSEAQAISKEHDGFASSCKPSQGLHVAIVYHLHFLVCQIQTKIVLLLPVHWLRDQAVIHVLHAIQSCCSGARVICLAAVQALFVQHAATHFAKYSNTSSP